MGKFLTVSYFLRLRRVTRGPTVSFDWLYWETQPLVLDLLIGRTIPDFDSKYEVRSLTWGLTRVSTWKYRIFVKFLGHEFSLPMTHKRTPASVPHFLRPEKFVLIRKLTCRSEVTTETCTYTNTKWTFARKLLSDVRWRNVLFNPSFYKFYKLKIPDKELKEKSRMNGSSKISQFGWWWCPLRCRLRIFHVFCLICIDTHQTLISYSYHVYTTKSRWL